MEPFTNPVDDILEEIAKKYLFVDTLVPSGRDRLDFYNTSVGCMKAALQAAFEAGKKAA